MELKQLHYFVTVVEEGSITGAARRLHLTQPPLSAQMRLLEEELGCRLLERGPRNVRLTEAGRTLHRHALSLLEMSRVAREEVASGSSEWGGVVRLGLVSSVIDAHAAEWLAAGIAQDAGICFEIHEANTYEMLEKLRAGLLHAAVIRTPYAAEGLTRVRLREEPLLAVGPAALLGDAEVTTFAALAGKPLIMYRRWEEILRKAFHERNLEMRVFCVNDDARTTARLAERGLGIGILPASGARLAEWAPGTGILPASGARLAEWAPGTGIPPASGICVVRSGDVVARRIRDCDISSAIDLVFRAQAQLPACAHRFIEAMRGLAIPDEPGAMAT